MRERIDRLIRALCAPECNGRKPGTPGGLAARRIVREALVDAGLAVREQPIEEIDGANLIGVVDGEGALASRAIVVGAHYDHLGADADGRVYWGADDNAAAVAVLVEVARVLAAAPPAGRRVVIVAFDSEEPPYFMSRNMGSEHFARRGDPVAPEAVDTMIAMDLVGHAVGPEAVPDAVRRSLFVLGAEKARGLGGLVDAHGRDAAPDLAVRRLDAEVIAPMSDYDAFWRRSRPFLFLTCGRSAVYHTPEDTPEKIDLDKVAATAAFLAELTLALRTAEIGPYDGEAHDDAATVGSIAAMIDALAPFSAEAEAARPFVTALEAAAAGRALEVDERNLVAGMIARIESSLA